MNTRRGFGKNSPVNPQLRLVLFWLAQAALGTADYCLFAALSRADVRLGVNFLGVWLLLLWPHTLIAPVTTEIDWPARRRPALALWVLCRLAIVGMALALAVAERRTPTPADNLAIIGLAGLILLPAVLVPARWAVLPLAIGSTDMPATRLTACSIAIAFVAAAAGMMVGALVWADKPTPATVIAIFAGLMAVGLAFSGKRPEADQSRDREGPGSTRAFFSSIRRIWSDRNTRGPLFGLVGYGALLGASAATIYGETKAVDPLGTATDLWVFLAGGAALGCGVAAIVAHPFRFLGLSAYGAFGFLLGVLWLAIAPESLVPRGLLGFAGSWVVVSFLFLYLDNLPPSDRGPGVALLQAGLVLGAGGLALLAAALFVPANVQCWILVGAAVLGFVLVVRTHIRPAIELLASLLFMPMYRISAVGPGVEGFPRRGPLLVVANHASWFDPLWLGKVIPRSITPLMLSTFYDLPILSWLMRRVVRAIRVQESTYRQHAPELNEAVARLDRGELVVIFPEAVLRRREDQLVRRFAQGVWHILRQRPETPVIACWIEGGWGSYFSHRFGPPGHGKPFDWRRPITIVISQPEAVPPEVLADHRTTRHYLRERVLAARDLLPPAEREEPASPRPPSPETAKPVAETLQEEE